MKEICLDVKDNIKIYTTPILVRQSVKEDFTNIDIKYRKQVEDFYRILSLNVKTEYLNAFFNNIKNVRIKKSVLIGLFYSAIHDGTYASYDITKNKIFLYQEELSGVDFYHELLHLSSSIRNPKNNMYYCGFSQNSSKTTLGNAINEGYTEYLCSNIFEVDNDSYYQYEMIVAKLLEMIVGKNNMQKLYFNADLYNLVNLLTNVNTLLRIKNFLFKTDYILDKRDSSNTKINEKVIRYMFDVNFFLIETYRNLLLKIYENKKISINELFYSYKQFMENINMLLDIDLPMDKDVLRSNINDTDFMHMIKIRKLI